MTSPFPKVVPPRESCNYSHEKPTANDTIHPATVQKIITETLSSPALQAQIGLADPSSTSMTFAKETRDLLIECCVEFITMLSSEANEIAEKDAKKTIACEHIIKALEELGFAEYVPSLHEVADSFKSSQVVSRVAFAGLGLGVGERVLSVC